ncbi:MAG TPA: nitroreductase [Candidatus Cybelea sp.]|nr:nitroreductase [Candidatus Cybelea sp.]
MEALRTRRACREFTEEPIERSTIEDLIAAAILAPSAMNLQPWAFVVVNGAARLHAMSAEARRVALDHLPSSSPLRAHLAVPHFEIFHNAAALIVICATGGEQQAAEDCCLAAENLMLAAHAKGFGTCWIGLSRLWLGSREVKAELGIAPDLHPVAPIILGRPRTHPPATPRNAPKIIWAR